MLTEEKERKLDEKLKELAKTDFNQFCVITGVDKIQAYVCIEKNNGKSVRQLEISLGIPRSTIGDICKRCPK